MTLYWLERGVDAWRLDAAYAVAPSAWADILPVVRSRYPEAYFVGEVIHGNYAGYIVEKQDNKTGVNGIIRANMTGSQGNEWERMGMNR
ncbi:MAG: hypothetical protein PHI97_33190 [Desulfobulbus sp.]|nr:hypothetical protein [Desulfobulbus sp.]